MPVLLQIACGGALGAMLRFYAMTLAGRWFGAGFPIGTGIVNVAGSFAMGVAFVLVATAPELGLQRLSPFLTTGLLGGFTTFSAFSLETFAFVEEGRLAHAAAYVLGTVALCLAAVALGALAARSWSAA